MNDPFRLAASGLPGQVTAVILAGGPAAGSAGRQTAELPQVLAPVAGRPFIHYLLDQLIEAGVPRAIVCTGHQARQVEQTLGPRYGTVQLQYSREQQPLGTAGAVRLAAGQLTTPLAMVLNGDCFCGGSLAHFLHWHRRSGFRGSLLLVHRDAADRYGRVTLGSDNAILAFEEKRDGLGPGLVNAGVYLLCRELLEQIPSQVPLSLERDVFPGWAARGLLGGYPMRVPFLDIGLPEAFSQAQDFFASLDLSTLS